MFMACRVEAGRSGAVLACSASACSNAEAMRSCSFVRMPNRAAPSASSGPLRRRGGRFRRLPPCRSVVRGGLEGKLQGGGRVRFGDGGGKCSATEIRRSRVRPYAGDRRQPPGPCRSKAWLRRWSSRLEISTVRTRSAATVPRGRRRGRRRSGGWLRQSRGRNAARGRSRPAWSWPRETERDSRPHVRTAGAPERSSRRPARSATRGLRSLPGRRGTTRPPPSAGTSAPPRDSARPGDPGERRNRRHEPGQILQVTIGEVALGGSVATCLATAPRRHRRRLDPLSIPPCDEPPHVSRRLDATGTGSALRRGPRRMIRRRTVAA